MCYVIMSFSLVYVHTSKMFYWELLLTKKVFQGAVKCKWTMKFSKLALLCHLADDFIMA